MIKHTHFSGGGLRPEEKLSLPALAATQEYTLPPYIDSNPYCLSTSPQGNHPYCAAVAVAGAIETWNWRKTKIQRQIDHEKIYEEAKRIDGNTHDGTTLMSAFQAASGLDLLDCHSLRVINRRSELQYAMLMYDVVVAGFEITDNWNHVDTETGWLEDNGGDALGGHAVLVSWWNDSGHSPKGIGFKNSWDGWGCDGFGRMSWEQFEAQFLYAVVAEQ